MDVEQSIKPLAAPYGAVKGSRAALVGICVGHSRIGDKGAVGLSGTSEWNYNKQVAELLSIELRKRNVKSVVFSSYQGKGYGSAMAWIATQLNVFNVDFAVELHFNSADSLLANGYEFLYWHKSRRSKQICETFQKVFNKRYPNNTDRGTKGLTQESRGALFTRLTSMPSVILEPFFGSNKQEWEYFGQSKGGVMDLVNAYADAIESCIVSL
jgi:N-acetylmuramoyl-L-alanine amidase